MRLEATRCEDRRTGGTTGWTIHEGLLWHATSTIIFGIGGVVMSPSTTHGPPLGTSAGSVGCPLRPIPSTWMAVRQSADAWPNHSSQLTPVVGAVRSDGEPCRRSSWCGDRSSIAHDVGRRWTEDVASLVAEIGLGHRPPTSRGVHSPQHLPHHHRPQVNRTPADIDSSPEERMRWSVRREISSPP